MQNHQKSKIKNQKSFPIPCVIFAGGRSSRMGEDKALLPFGGYDTLAEYQYRRLYTLFSEVYISAKENKFTFDAPLILDTPTDATYAPTAGFVAMFQKLQQERVFVISVDSPFVGEEEIRKLLEEAPAYEAVVARTESGTHPMCGIYHRRLLPKFEKMLDEGRHRLGQMLKDADTQYVLFDNEQPFANLNVPQEYQNALKAVY